MFSLPFSVRQVINIFIPDFSVRQKKIPSRNPKMDIFKMSKNVQIVKMKGSFK